MTRTCPRSFLAQPPFVEIGRARCFLQNRTREPISYVTFLYKAPSQTEKEISLLTQVWRGNMQRELSMVRRLGAAMVYLRVGRGLVAFAGSLLPLCVLWRLMLLYTGTSATLAPEPRIPMPAKAPPSLLGPADVLVYGWMVLCAAAISILVVAAVCVPVAVRPGRSVAVWGFWSLLVGMLCTAPWCYGFLRLLLRN